MSEIVRANQFLNNNQFKHAEQLYRQLLQQNPNNIDALWGLGKVALALHSYQASYDIFTRCVQLSANIPALWLSLAQSCQKLQRFKQAEQSLLNAYSLKVDHVPSLLSLAIFYCQSNQLRQAKEYLDKLFIISPDNVRAFCLKVRIKSQQTLDQHAQDFLARLKQQPTEFNKHEQVLLHYAFAQLFQKVKNYKVAFDHFTQANLLQNAQCDFSVADMNNYFCQLRQTFSKTFIEKMAQMPAIKPKSQPDLTPIFIVGQPRSGSTLLEQMLISHSDISSGGELPFLAGDIAQGILDLTTQAFPLGCNSLTPKHCEILRQHYLTNMQTLAPNAKYIIDKMPANYQSIGLIKMLFPDAKVICISRNVKAVSWSIFTNHFAAPEPYFCSLSEIASYHEHYQNVMSHWQQVLPDFIYHVSYEQLVKSPTEVLTDVLSYCNLTFQVQCLNFANEQRHIDTLSDVQLRSGLDLNRNEAWRPYTDFLPAYFNDLS